MAQLVLQALVEHQIEQVVISPGSRNAPLTIGFANHPKINTQSIVDERSAGFFALGLAQQSGKPVALLCTSGSALLNYYPAVAEAYYSRVPLLILSADRPAHLIDIGDGQTIRQPRIFEEHICFESGLDEKNDLEESAREIRAALETLEESSGPVHLNLPFDEPLYETVTELYDFGALLKPKVNDAPASLLKETPVSDENMDKLASIWNSSAKKMIILGVHHPDELIQIQLDHLAKDPSVLILTETTSNVSSKNFISNIDQLIFSLSEEELSELRPEVLITFGGMVVSKKIKQFLRRHQPDHHWHVDPNRAMNTYHCLEQHIPVTAQLFFSQFFFLTETVESEYQDEWLTRKQNKKKRHREYLDGLEFSDFLVFYTVFRSLPQGIRLQLSNSSVIRYAQLFDLGEDLDVFCNRGTSGIDGSTSTAVGAATVFSGQTVFVTGDLSFFYDSNAFWNSYIPSNFRVIVVNNSGGGIFRILPGPKKSGALDYFETPHQLDASHLCKMHGIDYQRATDLKSLESALEGFFNSTNGPRLLEIFTPSEVNDRVLMEYFKFLDQA